MGNFAKHVGYPLEEKLVEAKWEYMYKREIVMENANDNMIQFLQRIPQVKYPQTSVWDWWSTMQRISYDTYRRRVKTMYHWLYIMEITYSASKIYCLLYCHPRFYVVSKVIYEVEDIKDFLCAINREAISLEPKHNLSFLGWNRIA